MIGYPAVTGKGNTLETRLRTVKAIYDRAMDRLRMFKFEDCMELLSEADALFVETMYHLPDEDETGTCDIGGSCQRTSCMPTTSGVAVTGTGGGYDNWNMTTTRTTYPPVAPTKRKRKKLAKRKGKK